MIRIPYLLLAGMLLLAGLTARAAIETYPFSSEENEQRYLHLVEELRCLVCQNQNLHDSNAELAQDLRRQVFEMIESGASDQQIVDFMVDRYGDFVLYRPPMRRSTWLLWFGPILLAVVGVVVLLRLIRRSNSGQAPEIPAEERERVKRLLEQGRD